MNRSTQPLPSGLLTNDGLDRMPTNRKLRSTILISSSTCASAKHILGPRFFFGIAPCNASSLCRRIVAREIFHTVQTRLIPKGFNAEGDIVAD